MGKNKKSLPPEEALHLPPHPDVATPIIDTHTHLLSTFEAYRNAYDSGKYTTVWEFVGGLYQGRRVDALIDVWCEAPVRHEWKAIADSAMAGARKASDWGGLEYWFIMGVHPLAAAQYSDQVENEILEAMAHPRCVGWGEIGLDYASRDFEAPPPNVQRSVFIRQLRHAIRLGKPLTIHTREAEEDTESILKEEVPKDHKIHIHCFTDSPEWATRMLDHFSNLYIGITGVITYASNVNTPNVIRNMLSTRASSPSASAVPVGLRILLETDAPFMIPANLYPALARAQTTEAGLKSIKGKRLPLCHSAMIPWIAEFIASISDGVGMEGEGAEAEVDGGKGRENRTIGTGWSAEQVMQAARENARKVYGI